VVSIDGPSRVVQEAAVGHLPAWAEASAARREHMARVARLMEEWADRLGVSAEDRARWAAAGWLHDALRDADPASLRPLVPSELRDLPDSTLHGPAAAERLVGAVDPELRDAIRYHSVGHPTLATMGRALYLADFLEPGRTFSRHWHAELRAMMPDGMQRVLLAVLRARILHLLEECKPIRPETAAFWSRVAADARR
jgi:HD superfamily phosphohydrolase YqeK